MRITHRLAVGVLGLLGVCIPPAWGKGPAKDRTLRGAFSLKVPAGRERVGLRADYESSAHRLTISVDGKSETPPYVLTLPGSPGGPVRSQLVQLAGGAHALVLRFGAPDAYVLVLLAPEANAATSLEGVVVLKGAMSTAEAAATNLEVIPAADGDRLILSETAAPNVGLCGRSAKLTRALDPARGRFVRVGVPVLGAEERKRARKLTARVAEQAEAKADFYLGPWPSAYETTDLEAPILTDGRLLEAATPYEVVDLSLAAKAGLESIVVRVKEGAPADAPFDLWLLTEQVVFEVDTAAARGASELVIDLPPEVHGKCLGLTVGARAPFVEAAGRVSKSDAARVAALLRESSPGAEAEWPLRQAALARPSVVVAMARDYASLSPSARTRAEELARLAEASDAERFWVRQAIDSDEGPRSRGRARLKRLPNDGVEALARALAAAAPRDELALAQLLAETSSIEALRPIARRLEQPSAARRLELRNVLWPLAQNPGFFDEVGVLLEDDQVPRAQKVEVVRALAPAVVQLEPKARAEVVDLLSSASFHEAYVLAPAALALAPRVAEARGVVSAWLGGTKLELSPTERAALRTALLEAARDGEIRARFLAASARALLADPFVRVRAAAGGYLELVPNADAADALATTSRKDDFPRVREAMLGALGSLRDDPKLASDAEDAMIRALAKDAVPSVRGRAARALDRLPRPSTTAALRRSLSKDDSALVRAEAARSLGLVCDQEALGVLTDAARGLTRGVRDEADVRLGLNAVTALARLAPRDLEQRLAPLTSPSVPGPLRSRVESAIASGKGGCATAKER